MTTAEVLPATLATAGGAFDYAGLDTETRIVVQQRTSEIRTIARRAASDIIEIGQKLIDVKDRLGHGQFGRWLEAEFAWQERTAQSFMAVAERFKSANIADLNFAPTALYMLAAPSVPEEARQEALQRAEAGEKITVAAAKQIIVEAMASAADLKPDALAWARRVHAADPRGVLLQIVNSGPLSTSHFERLGDYLRERGHRFMRQQEREAVQQLIDELPRTTGRTAVFDSSGSQSTQQTADAGPGAAPVTRATCRICGRAITDPVSVARGYGDECAGKASAGGNGHAALSLMGSAGPAPVIDPEPQPEPEPVDLPAVVLGWLEERVDNLEMAGDNEARVLCLEQVMRARNGFAASHAGAPSGEAAWKSLRAAKGWPAGADNDTKINAVKATLARLRGEEDPSEEVEEVHEDDTEPVAMASGGSQAEGEGRHDVERPPHSWDGVDASRAGARSAGGNGKRPSPSIGSDTYRTLLDRKSEHVERGVKAAIAFKRWADSHKNLLDEDADLAAVFALSEDFRIQALCLD